MPPAPASVRAELTGDEFELRRLYELFRAGSPRVVRGDIETGAEDVYADNIINGFEGVEGRYFLVDDDVLDGLFGTPIEMMREAKALMELLTGFARVDGAPIRTVAVGGNFYRGDGAAPHNRLGVSEGEPIVAYDSAGPGYSLVDGVPQIPPAIGPPYVQLATNNLYVRKALRIISRAQSPTFYDQWKLWEIIRDTGGGEDAVIAAGWATVDELEAFRQSVNDEGISGDVARHTRQPQTKKRSAPTHTLTEAEAAGYILRLTRVWLDSLL